MTVMTDLGAGWLQKQHDYAESGFVLDEGQIRCVEVLCSFSTAYNLNIVGKNRRPDYGFRFSTHGRLDVSLRSSLGTYDFGELTSLVIAAHRHHVRVELSPQTVMLDLQEEADCQIDDYHIDPDCDHGEWGWGSCQCHVTPVSVMDIGLNSKLPRIDSEHRWDWHPGLAHISQTVHEMMEIA